MSMDIPLAARTDSGGAPSIMDDAGSRQVRGMSSQAGRGLLMTEICPTVIAERRDRKMGKNPGLKTRSYREDQFAPHAIDRSARSPRGPLQLNPP
jgi:hypothetical protein